MKALIGVTLACAVAASCVDTRSPVEVPAQTIVRTSSVWIAGWSDPDRLLVNVTPDPGDDQVMSWLSISDAVLSPLKVAPFATCDERWTTAVGTMSAGEVYVVETCRTREVSGDLLINHSVLMVEPQSRRMERIATVLDRPGLGIVAVRDDHTQTVVSLGSRICQELALVGVDTVSPLPVTIQDGDQSANLADDADRSGRDCSQQPRVDSPAWSSGPNPTLAFIASLDAIGRDGTDRLDAPGGLYLWDGEAILQPVLRGLRHVRTVSWSPDGQSIAFGAEIDGQGSGTWLYRPGDGALVRLSSQPALSSAWAPDGGRLAISLEVSPQVGEIVILDLSGVAR